MTMNLHKAISIVQEIAHRAISKPHQKSEGQFLILPL